MLMPSMELTSKFAWLSRLHYGFHFCQERRWWATSLGPKIESARGPKNRDQILRMDEILVLVCSSSVSRPSLAFVARLAIRDWIAGSMDKDTARRAASRLRCRLCAKQIRGHPANRNGPARIFNISHFQEPLVAWPHIRIHFRHRSSPSRKSLSACCCESSRYRRSCLAASCPNGVMWQPSCRTALPGVKREGRLCRGIPPRGSAGLHSKRAQNQSANWPSRPISEESANSMGQPQNNRCTTMASLDSFLPARHRVWSWSS